MTLPSRKKHQTTVPNTIQTIADDRLCVGIHLPALLKTISIVCAIAVGASVLTTASAQDSPLERLQKRSADERWKSARNQWLPVEQAPADFSTPFLPFSNSLPFDVLQEEVPQIDSQIVDERPVFEVPAPLFDPQTTPMGEFGSSANDADESMKLTAKPLVIDKPFELQVPAKSLRVPDPYLTQFDDTAKPEKVISPFRDSQGVSQFKLAQRDPLPPAPVGSPRKPLMRSISEIQPFHDYVPPKDSKSENQFVPGADGGPEYLALPGSGSFERNIAPTHYHWMASNLKHDTLYFEDVSLERYGHTYIPGVQPFVSLSKFGLQVIGLPYQMALDPVWNEQYVLGYYRPGDNAPPLRYQIPFNKRAAVTAAGAYTGLIFLFP